VLFAKDGQIYLVQVSAKRRATAMDRGDSAFIKLWGRNGAPRWSPDGSKIAFVQRRLCRGWSVFVARADGTGLRRITPCR
jgi:Tol biopolymer transport system component